MGSERRAIVGERCCRRRVADEAGAEVASTGDEDVAEDASTAGEAAAEVTSTADKAVTSVASTGDEAVAEMDTHLAARYSSRRAFSLRTASAHAAERWRRAGAGPARRREEAAATEIMMFGRETCDWQRQGGSDV